MQESIVRFDQTDMNVESRLEVLSDLTFIIHSKHLSQDDEIPGNWHGLPVNHNTTTKAYGIARITEWKHIL